MLVHEINFSNLIKSLPTNPCGYILLPQEYNGIHKALIKSDVPPSQTGISKSKHGMQKKKGIFLPLNKISIAS